MVRFVKALVAILLNLIYRIEVVGRENIPESGSALLCANHNGELDMFFIGFSIKRLIHYMAKEELFKNPLVGAVIRKLGAFPVKRGKGDVKAIKTALGLLKEGHIVGIFPEGTRMKGKSKKNIKVKPGAAFLVVNSGVPVIPTVIKGRYKPFSRIKVVFGQPYYIEADKDKSYTNSEMVEISEGIMNKVYNLMEDE